MSLFELADFEETRPKDMLPCGHRIWDLAHYEDCLRLVCPICGLSEESPYFLWSEHGPYENGHRDLCNFTQFMFDRFACCMACRSWTFGHSGCTHEGCPLFEAGHGFDFLKPEPVVCGKCGVPPRMVRVLGLW